jgi:hypothetical protein
MSRSDYEIVRIEDDRVFIVDLDLGNMSVTNDADYVLREINENFPNRRLIYRDTLGGWDEIKYSDVMEPMRPHNLLLFVPYNEHIPQDNEMTGCPNSSFIKR